VIMERMNDIVGSIVRHSEEMEEDGGIQERLRDIGAALQPAYRAEDIEGLLRHLKTYIETIVTLRDHLPSRE